MHWNERGFNNSVYEKSDISSHMLLSTVSLPMYFKPCCVIKKLKKMLSSVYATDLHRKILEEELYDLHHE